MRGRHIRSARVSALALALILVACASFSQTVKRTILIANDGQDAAARTYNDAKAQEAAAGKACAAKLGALPTPTPENWPGLRDRCAAAGTPIPYDPFMLQKAAGPINALYDGVRSLAAIDKAWSSGQATEDAVRDTIVTTASLFVQATASLTEAKISVPAGVLTAADELRKAGAK